MVEKNVNIENFAKEAQKALKGKKLPPVHLWEPDFCGDIDMQINRDGSWDYMGSPISRLPMVKLFSTILRYDDDGKYYLVTPVEKVGIRVEDVPFTAVELVAKGQGEGQILLLRTNLDDYITVDDAHPLRISFDDKTGEPSPYVLIRTNLEALLTRSVYYQLAELVVENGGIFGVWSSGKFYGLEENSE